MRKYMLPLMTVVCLAGFVFGQQPKIAVIDMETVVRLHPNTTADKKLLEETLKEFTSQKEQLETQFENAREAFEDAMREVQNPALSAKAKQKAEENAMQKQKIAVEHERELTKTLRSLQRQLTDQEVRMLKRTTAEIEKAVAAYAKANQIDLVLQLPGEKLGAVSGVLYAAPSMNITPEIMQLMGIKAEDDPEADAKTGAKSIIQE